MKSDLIEAVISSLKREFESLMRASKESRGEASDGESRSEGKYDTRSTEANYLADGQAIQAEAAAAAAAAFKAMGARNFAAGDAIALGALVEVKMGGSPTHFLIGPGAGGHEIEVDGKEITVITPQSPLGKQLLGLRSGEKTADPAAEVISVC
jgi:hypothetical protein